MDKKKEDLYPKSATTKERGLLMDKIISEIVEILNKNQSLIGSEMALEPFFTKILSE